MRNPDEKNCKDCIYHDAEKDDCQRRNALSVLTNGMFCAEFEEIEEKEEKHE